MEGRCQMVEVLLHKQIAVVVQTLKKCFAGIKPNIIAHPKTTGGELDLSSTITPLHSSNKENNEEDLLFESYPVTPRSPETCCAAELVHFSGSAGAGCAFQKVSP